MKVEVLSVPSEIAAISVLSLFKDEVTEIVQIFSQ
jgi:hypothetical protein